MGGEVLARELLASAVEEDEDRGGSGGLAIEPGEQGRLGRVGLRVAREIAGGACEVVGC
jgi:hypothetical protein